MAPQAGGRTVVHIHRSGGVWHVTRDGVFFGDYMSEAVISKTTDDAGVTRLVENFEAMAAPWLSGIRDIESLARELNLTVIDNFKTAALHERYWPGRAVTSPIFDHYSVCTLAS